MKRIITKACPFCATHGEWSEMSQHDSKTLWAFGCTNEICEINPKTDYYENQREAASVWNCRSKQPKEVWAMEFIFSEDKANALGYTAQDCYSAVDKLFARYGIKPEEKGVYVALESQNAFTAFGMAQRLPDDTDWFLKVIDQWLFYEDDVEPEDCLEVFYRIKARNS